MERKVILLLLIGSLLILGCISLEDLFGRDEYEIFSNLPTDNAKTIGYFKFTEDGVKELQETFGTLLTGGSLKRTKGGEAGFVLYNDSFGIIVYTKTDMSIDESLEELNSSLKELYGRLPYAYMPSQEDGFKVEVRKIGEKEITVVYFKADVDRQMPVCLWKEGDVLKTLITFGYPTYSIVESYGSNLEQGLGNETESPLIGYALKTLSQVPPKLYDKGKFEDTCDVILEKKYDTEKVKELFKDAEEIKKKIPVSGKLFGELKLSANLGREFAYWNGSIYGAIFGDENADHLAFVLKGNVSDEDNLCYSSQYGGVKSEIVSKDGKQACLKEGGGGFFTINLRFITLERKVGDYSVMVGSYMKGKRDVVKEEAKNIVFSINLPGEEKSWTDKAKIEVKVYSGTYVDKQPLAEVRVDLFKSLGYSYDGAYYDTSEYLPRTRGELIKTLYTNDAGVAKFEDLPLNESLYIVASKTGYENETRYIYAGDKKIEMYLTKSETNLNVRVYEEAVYGESDYGIPYQPPKPISEARVRVYRGGELFGTNYTNSNGLAVIQNVPGGSAKLEVSKEGYTSQNKSIYVDKYSRETSIYLKKPKTTAPAENCSGNYTVQVWPSEAPGPACRNYKGDSIPSTGSLSATWFNWGGESGCGGWKVYVTLSSQIKIHGYSDSCAGCILWHINYYLDDYYNSTWNEVGYVDGPDEPGATYDFCYTPRGNRIKIRSTDGFYVQVFKK